MSIVEYYGDRTPGGVLRYWKKKTKDECAWEISRCWNRIEELEKALTQQQEAEPVAYSVFADNGNIRIWCADPMQAQSLREQYGDALRPLFLHPPAAQPAGWDAEAYKSACDGLEHWRTRAEEAEQALERIREDLSPTYMGEPVVHELCRAGFTKAVRGLVFAARTSGGTAGRDDHLCLAIDVVESLLPAAKEEGK